VPEPDSDVSRPGSETAPTRWRATAWLILEVTALLGVAVTQPILDVFGKAPEVFVEASASKSDMVGFVVAVAFALPILCAVALSLTRLVTNDRVVGMVGVAIVVTSVGLIGVQVGRQVGDSAALVGAIAIAITTGVTCAYIRTRWLHTWLRFLSIAPVLFAAAFVVASPAGDLMIGDEGRAGDAVAIEPGDRGPVVLLVLDELPTRSLFGADGTIDAERFPGFARLASQSTWFRNTTAVSSNTLFAVPAIFTGQYPKAKSTGSQARHHPDSLFRLLAGSYRLNVGEYVTRLCGAANCDPTDPTNAPRPEYAPAPIVTKSGDPLPSLLRAARSILWSQLTGRDVDLDVTNETPDDGLVVPDVGSPTTGSKVSNTAQPARFAEWLARIDGDLAKPQLNVLHTVIPHHPWRLDGEGTLYEAFGTKDVGFSKFAWLDRPGAVVTMRQRHLEMVRYADKLVDSLLTRLERLDIWDDTTVIVTADHGASFVAGQPFRSWTEATQTDIVGVPLFVHGPGFEIGAIDDAAAQSVDIVPTIAGALDVDIPWEVDGIDLADPPPTRTTHPFAVKGFPNEAESRAYQLIDIDVSNHLDDLLAVTPSPESTGGGPLGTWRTGPHPELIDEAVSDVGVGESASVVFHPIGASLVTTTSEPSESGVLALLVGSLSGDVAPGDVVAIALDGRIVSTASIDEDDRGASVLSAFVAPSLVDGAGHDVRIFMIGGGTGPILHPIGVDV
jgi:Sulfatase